MNFITRVFCVAFAGRLCFLACASAGADWPQWLGPQRDGVLRESGIHDRFPDEGPPVLWRVEVNSGYSGPAVSGGRVFLTDWQQGTPLARKPGDKGIPELPGTERVLCLESATGRKLWEHSYPRAYRIDYPSGPRTSPVIHQERVYTLGAMGDLLCLDAGEGRLIWSHDLLKEFTLGNPPMWGWAAHPLIYRNILICLVGGEGSAVVGFNVETGEEIWRALSTREICYAPPVLFDAPEKPQLIVWLSDQVAGLDPGTGEVYWSKPFPPEGKPQRPEVHIAMPRISGDLLFLTSYYQGSALFQLHGDATEATQVWVRKSTSRSSFNQGLHTVMATPAIQEGHIYGVCGSGELRCLNLKTGERLWETYAATGGKRAPFATAFLIAHEGRFFIWNDQGELILARLEPAGYVEISRAKLFEPVENARGREVVWSHPAFAGQRVFLRNHQELICVSVAAGPAQRKQP
jgi:outer membrane protein assembly factor BamB